MNNLEFGFSTQYAPNIFYTPITQHYFSVAFTDDIQEQLDTPADLSDHSTESLE